MSKTTRTLLWAFAATLFASQAPAASNEIIRGTVTDNAGKPIRGAIVKAVAMGKTASRFSQDDGRFEIAVPAGSYQVSATAFGFAPSTQAKDAATAGDSNFRLSPGVDVMRLSGADLETLMPGARDAKLIRTECVDCHNLSNVMKRRGSTAAEWMDFLRVMTGNRPDDNPQWPPQVFAAIGNALEKYAGPNGSVFGPDADVPTANQIHHTTTSEEALKATFHEYQIPGSVMAHSIDISADGLTAWFSGGGKINRFNVREETFQKYDIPAPGAGPHTPVVAPNGIVYMGLAGVSPVKLAAVDPETGAVKAYAWPEQKYPAHSPSIARDGNLWLSSFAPGEVWKFDLKKEQFRAYHFPVPEAYVQGSYGALEASFGPPSSRNRFTGLPATPTDDWPYHIAEDSKGTLWFGALFLGTITSLNPETGEAKIYQVEGAPSTRGIAVDAQDNIWFNNFHGHRLGRIDAKTKEITQYELPTKNATGYGVVYEPRTGYLWIADMNGNNITRFDPKTRRFVEYPIPTHQAIPRFISVAKDGRVWFTEFFGNKIGVLDPHPASTQTASR